MLSSQTKMATAGTLEGKHFKHFKTKWGESFLNKINAEKCWLVQAQAQAEAEAAFPGPEASVCPLKRQSMFLRLEWSVRVLLFSF